MTEHTAVRRVRTVAAIVLVVAIVGLGALWATSLPTAAPAAATPSAPQTAAAQAADGEDAVAPDYVVVSEGDTAIELLAPLAPADEHPRRFVADVLEANDAEARSLRPGDVLVLDR